MVIVVVGLLAGVAVLKFVDLGQEAERSSVDGVFAAAQSASGINFAAVRSGRAGATPIIDGSTLIAAMESRPHGWNDSGNVMSFQGKSGTLYAIAVTGVEDETSKATLTKSW
ncbi:MAG: prepilin-type cleavage/methylation domain-containing protein [Magnetococcales bacterium]|nr:prepilin-type cleavage/methylation domain-containing protein [Magnetococcales bacterium]